MSEEDIATKNSVSVLLLLTTGCWALFGIPFLFQDTPGKGGFFDILSSVAVVTFLLLSAGAFGLGCSFLISSLRAKRWLLALGQLILTLTAVTPMISFVYGLVTGHHH
jgi:hypothetical protein